MTTTTDPRAAAEEALALAATPLYTLRTCERVAGRAILLLPVLAHAVIERADTIERHRRREPTQQEADEASDGASEAFVDGWTARRCRHCGRWVFGGPTACVQCADADAARAELASLRTAAHALLGSLGEYVRQSMHANPEWAPGIRAIEAALLGKFAPVSGLTAFEKDELASLRAREPLTEAEAQALAEHIEFFRARVSGSTKRAIMGWFASRRTTTTEGT